MLLNQAEYQTEVCTGLKIQVFKNNKQMLYHYFEQLVTKDLLRSPWRSYRMERVGP